MNSTDKLQVKDKYSAEIIGECSLDNIGSIETKISDAVQFFNEFKHSDSVVRTEYINVVIRILKEHRTHFENLICREAGKPLFYAKNELDRCIRTAELGLDYFDDLKIRSIDVDLSNSSFANANVKRFPVGLIFGISPFNFPLNLALHKIIPAIAAGNVILIKPSPFTPLSLTELIHKVNQFVPKGLLDVINCSNENAEYIVKHKSINMVSFTGSDGIGWHIKSLIPKKKCLLELGGNAAVYVHKDAELKGLALDLAKASCLYAGQICISTQRIFVHEEIYDQLRKEMIIEFNNLSSGKPQDNVINSPLIDSIHLDRLLNWINAASKNGAEVLSGGKAFSTTPPILSPTLIENVSTEDDLFQKEAFGPIATLHKVNNEDEAISLINNSNYGLQAGIFAKDVEVIQKCFNNIEVGGIIINGVPGFRRDEMPYGGIKDSGFGREGIKYAIEEMSELKLLIS